MLQRQLPLQTGWYQKENTNGVMNEAFMVLGASHLRTPLWVLASALREDTGKGGEQRKGTSELEKPVWLTQVGTQQEHSR